MGGLRDDVPETGGVSAFEGRVSVRGDAVSGRRVWEENEEEGDGGPFERGP